MEPGPPSGPASPEGVGLGELEAMVRRVVVEEMKALREALDRLEARAEAPNPASGSPVTVTLMGDRW